MKEPQGSFFVLEWLEVKPTLKPDLKDFFATESAEPTEK